MEEQIKGKYNISQVGTVHCSTLEYFALGLEQLGGKFEP
jgi:hypothetical protein